MDQNIIIEYLRKSYFAVDGLWYMMLEEEFTPEKALEIDERVWKVLPKIQARKAKELLSLKGDGLQDFTKAIIVKLESESYNYQIETVDPDSMKITVNQCPWYEILKKAKREHLAPEISDAICLLEFSVWLKEFGEGLSFNMPCRQCLGERKCVIDFYAK